MIRKEKKKHRPFRRFLKWTFLTLLLLLILAVGSAFLLAKYYEDAIKSLFVRELNKQLRTEIAIQDIHFSFLKQFPYATLEFEGLTAKDAVSGQAADTLMKVASLRLHFNIMDIYRGKYTIKRIDLQNGFLKMKVYKDLTDNFHFWKSTGTPSNDEFSFALDKVVMKKMLLLYHNAVTRQDYKFMLGNVQGKGRFSTEKYTLKISGDILVREIWSGGMEYFRDKEAELGLEMNADQLTGRYVIRKGKMKMGNLALSVTGYLVYSENNKIMDLHLTAPEAELKDLVKELPSTVRKKLEDYQPEGLVKLDIHCKGKYGGSDLPAIEAVFSMQEGKIEYSKENISLEHVTLSGTYNNNGSERMEDHHLVLHSFRASLNQGTIQGMLEINGFGPAAVQFRVSASLSLDDIIRFLPADKILKAAGNLKLLLSFSGNLESFNRLTVEDFLAGRFSGELEVKDLGWELKDNELKFNKFNGSLAFNNNDVVVKSLHGNLSNNSFTLEGYFRNLLPFLLSKSEDLQVKAVLSSPALDLETLLAVKSKGTDTSFRLAFPERWTGDISLDLGSLSFRKFKAVKVNCLLKYNARKLCISRLTMNTASGSFTGEGIIDGSSGKYFDISADALLKQMDVRQLFHECSNFGQEYVVAENLKGIVTVDLQTSFRMKPALGIDPASLEASLDITADHGELLDYKPISGLGKFIRVDDLSKVRFSTLKNTVYIKDKTVTIPSMDVVSDALNFTLSATHTFDNEINYRFQVLLSEILSKKARKARKTSDEFGVEQPDNEGRTTLFILMTGTVGNPVFRYDSKSVKGKIIASFLNEKKTLKKTLKDEFSRSKKQQDSLAEMEKHIRDRQESGKFVMDFEGSLKDSLNKQKKDRRSEKKESPEKKKEEKAKFKIE
ncbi:MAG: DUF3971 domain-containing protein, partial [Bacteroidetes bacterium]|nr:DUF3971 domain-containing protein [Bacteroidota bacterium]